MDYGRKGARKRKETLTSRGLAARHRALSLGLLILLVLVVGGIGYAGYRVYGYVKETIAAYEQGRIDEQEYLKRVLKYKDDILTHTDNELPEELQQNNAAKAYYGLALETYQRAFGDDVQIDLKRLALDTARTFDTIINRTLIVDGCVLVDWQLKSDIIGRMKIELEDYLIDEVKRKYELAFSFDDMDTIIDGCVDVAKLWIR